jgi:hypothetical protein
MSLAELYSRYEHKFPFFLLIGILLAVMLVEFTACGGPTLGMILPGLNMDPGVRIYG